MSMSKCVLFRNIQLVVKGHVTSFAASPAYNPLKFLQIQPFSSSSSSALKSTNLSLENQKSFTVNYLINSCGLTPERAVSASKHLKFEAANKPNAVLTFFKNQSFTHTQISRIVHLFPSLLTCDPEKIFLPKIEFFKSKGISSSEVAILVTRSPNFLAMSLENCLIPSFNFFSTFFNSEEKANDVFRRVLRIRLSRVTYAKSNINMLKQVGVPMRNISYFITQHSDVIVTKCKKFGRVFDQVKKMDFDPQNVNFLKAVKCLLSMTKSTWDRKIKVYEQWGWSEDDVISAFRKYPCCMSLSEDKMNLVMEHCINKMGLKSSFLAERPIILALSLAKRIVPRSLVYQVLVSKGLLKPCDTSLTTLIQVSEKCFTETITRRYGNEAPELLKLYMNTKLNLAAMKID